MTSGAPSTSQHRTYRIAGGRPLRGAVEIAGAKNAITKMLVASLLADSVSVIGNVPRIRELDVTLGMLADVGMQWEWREPSVLSVETHELRSASVGQQYSGINRIPILLLAPLYHRAGRASIPAVGGDKIGPRPVDFHMDVLRRFGATVEETNGGYTVHGAPLHGASITLPYPSVGATETALFAAVLARGSSVIANAAIEPEIIDTVLFLQKMGAIVAVDVDRRILVEGVSKLRGATHRAMNDRLEAASYAAAALATNGRVRVKGARQEHLLSYLNALRQLGGGFDIDDDGITFYRDTELRGIYIETDVHPGFATDWQPPFVVALTQASGVSVVHETVYESRFGYVEALKRAGADIEVANACLGSKTCRFKDHNFGHSCIVRGPALLQPRPVEIPDVRAGFAYIVAALVANGTSELSGVRYMERGYERVPEKLLGLGAELEVVDSPVVPA